MTAIHTFMTDLWESVFIPGPTPSVLIAANYSFGALQVVLFSLLLATKSFHFAFLSIICGGLWWGINWFVREVQLFQIQEKLAQKNEIISGSETETESSTRAKKDTGITAALSDPTPDHPQKAQTSVSGDLLSDRISRGVEGINTVDKPILNPKSSLFTELDIPTVLDTESAESQNSPSLVDIPTPSDPINASLLHDHADDGVLKATGILQDSANLTASDVRWRVNAGGVSQNENENESGDGNGNGNENEAVISGDKGAGAGADDKVKHAHLRQVSEAESIKITDSSIDASCVTDHSTDSEWEKVETASST